MESWQALGGLGAGRKATVIIVTLLTILLAFGCAPQWLPGYPSGKVIVAVGDIATCSSAADEATARLVGGKKILFRSDRHGSSDIYMMTLKDRKVVRLTSDPATTFGADWAVK